MLLAVLEGAALHTERLVAKKRQSSQPPPGKAPVRSLSSSTAPGLPVPPTLAFRSVLYVMSHSNCSTTPWPLKGSRTHLVPTLWPLPQNLPVSPARCHTKQHSYVCCPRWPGGFTLAGNRADNKSAKHGTKLNSSPPLQWPTWSACAVRHNSGRKREKGLEPLRAKSVSKP